MKERIIKSIINGIKTVDGGGVHLKRLIASPELNMLDPFLLLDEFGSGDHKEYIAGFPSHPHRGFETITYMIKGKLRHEDTAGNKGFLEDGSVQWMTAGKGVVHDEFHSRDFAEKGGEFEMVQLWVNLPAKHKMTKPRYQSLDKKDLPIVLLQDGTTKVKIIAGNFGSSFSPAETFTKINIYEVEGHQNSEVKLNFDDGTNTLILQLAGSSFIGDQHIDKGYLGIFSRSGVSINLKTAEDFKILILNGEPIEEPLEAYGPFVMNTREELMDAFRDFQEGNMGSLTE